MRFLQSLLTDPTRPLLNLGSDRAGAITGLIIKLQTGLSKMHNEMIKLLEVAANWSDAIELSEKNVELSRGLADKKIEFIALNKLASLYFASEDYLGAIYHFE